VDFPKPNNCACVREPAGPQKRIGSSLFGSLRHQRSGLLDKMLHAGFHLGATGAETQHAHTAEKTFAHLGADQHHLAASGDALHQFSCCLILCVESVEALAFEVKGKQ